MIRFSTLVICLLMVNAIFAQDKKDKEEAPLVKVVAKKDSSVTPKVEKLKIDSANITNHGVAVSPSTVRFRTKPGKREVQYVTITNDTYKQQQFKFSFSDVTMSNTGKIQQVPIGTTVDNFGLKQWISISPNFIELRPGEKRKVEIIIDLPDEDEAYKAAWCLLMIDQARERKYITPEGVDKESIAMGVIPTFGFGVYVYQNPPNVTISKVEIEEFEYTYDDKSRFIHLKAKNVGNGIAYCKSYLEINNFNTGYHERIPLKSFNVLPTQYREFSFSLPGNLKRGKYTVMAVLDFGSDEELEAAEIEFEIE